MKLLKKNKKNKEFNCQYKFLHPNIYYLDEIPFLGHHTNSMKVSIDSRTIQPGDYFIPVKGPHFNGRDFFDEVIKKGGIILDVDLSSYAKRYRKKLHCPVIGITGSAGKTTTKDMLTSVLKTKFKNVVATSENLNNEFGVPLTLLKADHDTDVLIVEMGMRFKGEIAYLTNILRPTHTIITSIGLTHVENFKNPVGIAYAKCEIFQKAKPWEKSQRSAFINYSSKYPELASKIAQKKGFSVFPFQGETLPEQNISLCYTVGRHFGLTDEEIKMGIDSFSSSSHRMKKHQIGSLTLLDDTYNANPDGMKYALQCLSYYSGRKIAVLADMLELGSFAEREHQKLSSYCLEAGVQLVFTFGNHIQALKDPHLEVFHFSNKTLLIQALKQEIKPGDTVLIKGSRGMKMEEVVNDFLEPSL